MGFFSLLYIYLIGGVTFLPLVVAALFLHAHLTLPQIDPKRLAEESSDGLRDAADTDTFLKSGGAASLEEKFKGKHDSDVAEGYFAVCREYVPGGVNGKPPERTTPAGEVVREESPSVYQSMYRSLFNRQQAPTLEPNKAAGRFTKKPRNIFYVVLRHGHLMLYDDEHQVEVRHVISLSRHKVDLYGGGNKIPEGELWIKRNAVRLLRQGTDDETDLGYKPFFFFSENCSAKEDFYFALLQNQDHSPNDPDCPPTVQSFDNVHMFNLIKSLHSSNEQYETRWLNALIGRLFLGLYKTQFIEDTIRMKITKKISRVKKPDFLTGIIIRNINLGKSGPLVTNPKLKDLSIDGNCCVEADFEYTGNARVEIAATVRIDLGSRFKAREVQLVLAVTLKKLAGHALLRFKPPPSNRAWITFETMPQMDMNVEPIVSSRQITYGVILRTIESRIREVFAETLVYPYWDDIPYMATDTQRYRGGIWAEENDQPSEEIRVPDEAPEDGAETESLSIPEVPSTISSSHERNASTPSLTSSVASMDGTSVQHRRSRQDSEEHANEEPTAASTAFEKRPEFPKSLRSTSTIAAPTVTTSSPETHPISLDSKVPDKDATSLMREISNRSPPETPQPMSRISPSRRSSQESHEPVEKLSDIESPLPNNGSAREASPAMGLRSRPSFTGSTRSNTSTPESRIPKLASLAKTLTPSETKQAQFAALAANTRSWTWGANKKPKHSPNPSGSSNPASGEPYGRGRPLPPVGQPLPPPERPSSFASSTANLLKRRSIPVPPSSPASHLASRTPPESSDERRQSVSSIGEVKRRPVPPPPLPSRRASRAYGMPSGGDHQDLVVVKAPEQYSPNGANVIADGGRRGDTGGNSDEEDLATPLARGEFPVVAPASRESTPDHGRADLTASEMSARAGLAAADLQPPPG